MKVMGLDLSTKTGWSIVEDMKLKEYGIVSHKSSGQEEDYPFNYIDASLKIADDVLELVVRHSPDIVVIEETNKGKNRYSQKQLEFIHYAVCSRIRHTPPIIVYLDTSQWRKLTKTDYSQGERQAKVDRKKAKAAARAEVQNEVWPFFEECFNEHLAMARNKSEKKRYTKLFTQTVNELVKESLAHKAVKSKDGKRLVNISKKDSSVRRVNEIFKTSFDRADNDICDSILLCVGYYVLIGAHGCELI
jgi:Holliday junction resolvasome RuvABC endonuclease subunit